MVRGGLVWTAAVTQHVCDVPSREDVAFPTALKVGILSIWAVRALQRAEQLTEGSPAPDPLHPPHHCIGRKLSAVSNATGTDLSTEGNKKSGGGQL